MEHHALSPGGLQGQHVPGSPVLVMGGVQVLEGRVLGREVCPVTVSSVVVATHTRAAGAVASMGPDAGHVRRLRTARGTPSGAKFIPITADPDRSKRQQHVHKNIVQKQL